MLETLNETVAAYTSETRAIDTGGSCRYFKAGRCCAVGRCLENPKRFASVKNRVSYLDTEYSLDLILKLAYRGFSLSFWIYLQELHDGGENWDKNGLSDVGKRAVRHIKRKFNLGVA